MSMSLNIWGVSSQKRVMHKMQIRQRVLEGRMLEITVELSWSKSWIDRVTNNWSEKINKWRWWGENRDGLKAWVKVGSLKKTDIDGIRWGRHRSGGYQTAKRRRKKNKLITMNYLSEEQLFMVFLLIVLFHSYTSPYKKIRAESKWNWCYLH